MRFSPRFRFVRSGACTHDATTPRAGAVYYHHTHAHSIEWIATQPGCRTPYSSATRISKRSSSQQSIRVSCNHEARSLHGWWGDGGAHLRQHLHAPPRPDSGCCVKRQSVPYTLGVFGGRAPPIQLLHHHHQASKLNVWRRCLLQTALPRANQTRPEDPYLYDNPANRKTVIVIQ